MGSAEAIKVPGSLWNLLGASFDSYVSNPVSQYLNDPSSRAQEAFRRGRAYFKEKLDEQACLHLKEALGYSILPLRDQCACNFFLGVSLFRLHRLEECKSYLEAASRATRSETPSSIQFGINMYRGIVHRNLMQRRESQSCLRMAISIAEVENANDLVLDALFELAKTSLSLEDFKSAREQFEKVLKSRPDHIESKINICSILYHTQQFEQALKLSKTLLSETKDNESQSFHLHAIAAQSEFQLKKYKECLESIEKALFYNKLGDSMMKLKAKVLLNLGREKDCITVLFGGEFPEDCSFTKTNGSVTPASFICPISKSVLRDPIVAMDGYSYERAAFEEWIQSHDTSPITGEILKSTLFTPNRTLKKLIEEFQ